MTIRETIDLIYRAAVDIYGEREARQIGRIMTMELGGYTPTQLVVCGDEPCHIEGLGSIAEQVSSGRPMQYILGQTEFCDLTFRVQEGVLIPRPETEELVRWIEEEHRHKSPRVVDVGTGSGAIAVSLSKLLPSSRVWGLDISDEALSQARSNSELNGADVTFVRGDALEGVELSFADDKTFDIVVSNPPYIPRSQGADMRTNVMNFEPHLALFVEDDDPLKFYRRIAESSKELLREGGVLYFEIHEDFAQEMVSMLQDMGYADVRCREDINQKPRMICAQHLS